MARRARTARPRQKCGCHRWPSSPEPHDDPKGSDCLRAENRRRSVLHWLVRRRSKREAHFAKHFPHFRSPERLGQGEVFKRDERASEVLFARRVSEASLATMRRCRSMVLKMSASLTSGEPDALSAFLARRCSQSEIRGRRRSANRAKRVLVARHLRASRDVLRSHIDAATQACGTGMASPTCRLKAAAASIGATMPVSCVLCRKR